MNNCSLCPRNCLADRTQHLGYCRATAEPEVASVCVHKGEEPPLCGDKGICNVFFAHCNLQCVFCQNYEISRGTVAADKVFYRTMDEVEERIAMLLPQTENVLGLVSASHYADQIPELIERLHRRGLEPTVVWNSNGYENPETLQMLAPYIDIYLPDYKYADSELARRYSNAADYPQVAQRALQEMVNQMGSGLRCDTEGLAFRGIIVRHLVLPGQVRNSIDCLRWLAENLGTGLHLSLMAQYFPPDVPLAGKGWPDALGRPLRQEEYDEVLDCFEQLGFSNGWCQELSAADRFRPDFSCQQAFEL